MSVSENIFRIMKDRQISQKEFSKLLGVPESTVSDWKRKDKAPSADRILEICAILNVSPYDILLDNSEEIDYIMVDSKTELGRMVLEYNSMNSFQRERLHGYMEGLHG